MNLELPNVIYYLCFWFLSVLCNKEGSRCLLKDGSKGICKSFSDCNIAMKDSYYLKYPEFCTDNYQQALVCCIDCSDIHLLSENKFQVPDYGRINDVCLERYYFKESCRKQGSIYEDLDDSVECYRKPQADIEGMMPVIAGGVDATRGQFPHMALIGYGDDLASAEWMCGGTVINEKYILSAAHCISSPQLGEIKYAALGILKRTDSPKMWQTYDVIKIIPYPQYKPPSKYHDIALLGTGAKIRFNKLVFPACLDRQGTLPFEAIATGWGALGHRKPLAETLQVVLLTKFTDKQCMAAYPQHRHLKHGYDSTTQVCYGDEDEIYDTCEGDSGGPLQKDTEGKQRSKCIYTVFGVTSYGRACGYVGSAGMYTRVAYYMPWIESITGKLN